VHTLRFYVFTHYVFFTAAESATFNWCILYAAEALATQRHQLCKQHDWCVDIFSTCSTSGMLPTRQLVNVLPHHSRPYDIKSPSALATVLRVACIKGVHNAL
jgi:hypothetical protein